MWPREVIIVIDMTFWYVFGTDLTFFELFKLYLGLITTPHVSCVHMIYVYPFFTFHSSHGHMAKKSHHHIMIFYDFRVLFYGRTPTLILFHFLHNPTTPILPIYVNVRRPHLQKNTTESRSVIQWKITRVPRRTFTSPD